jgi:hypothetical protein
MTTILFIRRRGVTEGNLTLQTGFSGILRYSATGGKSVRSFVRFVSDNRSFYLSSELQLSVLRRIAAVTDTTAHCGTLLRELDQLRKKQKKANDPAAP